MNKQTWLADIECYKNYFCLGLLNKSNGKRYLYEISEERDDRETIYRFCTTYTGFFVTFNGIHYDELVLKYLILEWRNLKYLNTEDLLLKLKEFSDKIFNSEANHNYLNQYKWVKVPWTSIDLILFWARSLRISKQISLKSLAIQLNYPVIQQLPFPPDAILKIEDLPILRHYNLEHDLGILDKLYDTQLEEINLREYVQKEYGIECWCMDAPKIASEYLLEDFCKKTYNKENGPYWQYKKSVRNTKYIPKPWKLGEYLPEVKFKTKIFQDLLEEIKVSDNTFNKKFYYENGDTKVIISLGVGGIHILNENETYKTKLGSSIRDQDVRSLYPTLLDNYKLIRDGLEIVLDKYLQMKDDRVNAKKNKELKKDTFLKLCLNGFTGIADSDVTWLYSPEHLIALRILGQLIQLRVIEEMCEIGVQVISNNTDGTMSIIPDELLNKYHEVSRNIEKEFNIDWEYAIVDKIVYRDVNNYICNITEEYAINEKLEKVDIKVHEKLKVKRKGIFKLNFDEKGNREIPLADSVNQLVVAKCLNLYYTKGIKPEEIINNPHQYNLHIYDFCLSKKINKDYEIYWNGEKQQQLNRYYFSKSEPYLYKKKKVKKTFENVNVGFGVKLFNNYEDKEWSEYKINTQYYISKVWETINNINNKNQLKLF